MGKAELRSFLGIGPKYVQRMIAATRAGDPWLEFAMNHEGRPRLRVLVTEESARRAQQRMLNGEEPPLLPCERRYRESKQRKQQRAKKKKR
jgi:hypothetical protein